MLKVYIKSDIHISTLGPIALVDNLRAVSELGHHYDLDDNYCLYCAGEVGPGNWEFVCYECHESVATGYFPLPACWINELYIDMYGQSLAHFMFSSPSPDSLVKKRPPGIPKGASHNHHV